MSKKMLINAHRGEQLRVAIVDGTDLVDYQVEIADAGLTRGNIYRGIVANIQPSLNAAFIDIGEDKHGFLSADDVLPKAYHKNPPEGKRPRIDQILERRKPIEVQVTKDGVGQKGPALTTNLALAGRYLVMMPYDGMRAISRKAEGVSAREKIKERLAKLVLPEGQGVIVRTNGLEQNQTTLNRDLNALQRLWKRIIKESKTGRGPRLLYSDQDLLVQALRDYLDTNIQEVLVDDDDAMEQARSYMAAFMPRSKTKLARYEERLPLFTRFSLESQIDRIYDREVPLPGGGSIVIDNTEALTAIDVNSGRATKTANHEESIFNVNQEAAREVARQLRLRDIGGLVVVDFIDMRLRKNQRKLEKIARDSMKSDKARNTVGQISPNGLVEINRQRIKQAIKLRTHKGCPTCRGVGTIPSSEFSGLNILRRIEARAASGTVQSVIIALHPEVAEVIQNKYRQQLGNLEREFEIQIEIIGTPHFKHSEERMDWTQRSSSDTATPKSPTGVKATDLTADPERRRRRSPKPAEEERVAGGEGEEEDTESRPRRRRRSRRGGRREEVAAAEVAEGSTQGESAEEGTEAAGETSPARPRRRRGGRRQRGGNADSEGATAATAENGDTSSQPQAPARSRGRRGRSPARADAAQGQEDANMDEAAEGTTRTRRGRGRRPEATAEASGNVAAPEETARPARARRSRGRTRQTGNDSSMPVAEGQPPRRGRGRSSNPRARDNSAPAYQDDPLPPAPGNGEGRGGNSWPGFPFSFQPKPLTEAQSATGLSSPALEEKGESETPKPRRSRARSKTSTDAPPEAPQEAPQEAIQEATQEAPKPRRTRSRKSASAEPEGGSSPEAKEETPKPKRSRARRSTAKDSEAKASPEDKEDTPKPKRPRTRRKAAKDPADGKSQEAAEETPKPKPRRPRTRRASAAAPETSEAPEAEKKAPKPRKPRARKSASAEPEAGPTPKKTPGAEANESAAGETDDEGKSGGWSWWRWRSGEDSGSEPADGDKDSGPGSEES